VYKTSSTEKQINILSEFRQVLYDSAFANRRDALFELLDALLLKGPMPSFPMLALSLFCQRHWPSLYQAIEEGEINLPWLRTFLAQQVSAQGICYYALDCAAWPRPQADTLPDRQYVYHPTQAVNGGTVVAGYAYSLLDWVPLVNRSWALSIEVARRLSTQTDAELGVAQVKRLNQARQSYVEVLDIIVADAKYGNHKFFQPLQGQRCGVVAAMRCDRVLYRAPMPGEQKSRGRKRKHGRRFAFKEPETWGQADEFLQFEHERWGQVELRRWNGLHERSAADTPLDVVQARVHLERDKPPKPFWLAWQAPPMMPPSVQVTAQTIWQAYPYRWPIEPSIRFRKQHLMWTVPQFHTPEAGDLWSTLVSLAMWELYLARTLVMDRPLPWQKTQTELTPARVQQGLGELFCTIGTPVRPPRTRGKSPGWPKGRVRRCRPRHSVVKKTPKKAKSAVKTA
jgi:hypothetical protein